ncbi:GNAT family N-acetyltransferase [Tetragenococcus koreensis]|uniref:GNAT family acetyltransferase n=1 Tax=Tetragenococcus koreensis TaxID=290335 RepID=A0AAN4ZS39_9ENTE|nr:GNAT family N-acetyltransferase [Tetragenococcus koreensis]MCF1616129.1 GNAT family N-acetyltransferase [Tetragenococcus koreensis]MCF1618519.1 GNAT family N-acetyltransferase [Tetragenococcus koreensis]MCF1621194.1 GNAT family N-acetyltransferase [Tetragenococcus koreensis]MCF1627111.1 GNAT family N-acetyltransferase [Tetragenococcus koreensis]MCF1632099.1 GNAT family N-acetyltransferase [Tetragenococcus koreensis]
MYIRKYTFTDKKAVIEMIKQTIQTINKNDYDENQLKAWSNIDESSWTDSVKEHQAIVMVSDRNKIVGFADMDNDGYLDRLFIHKDFQRMRIGDKLVNDLEEKNTGKKFSTFASITAKPFFEALGYKLVRKNVAPVRGQQLENYYMEK